MHMEEVKEINDKKEINNINNATINQNNNYNDININNNRNEKKVITYLIIISLILIYISFFFIHNIIDRGRIQNNASTTIPQPDNDVQGETIDKENIIVDNSDRFKIKQGETEFNEIKELDIFNNNHFEDKSIIAPGVEGDYSFTVENESESKFNYDITFTEENPYNVNMVYKVKVNGEYVLGNENNWVKGANLSRKDLFLNARTNDIYTIEWRWEDTDYDTEIGVLGGPGGAYYKMYINIVAEQIID